MTGDRKVLVRVIRIEEARAKRRARRKSNTDRLPPAPAMALQAS